MNKDVLVKHEHIVQRVKSENISNAKYILAVKRSTT